MVKEIVMATFGSFGDVNPFIAIAQELQRRGHRVVIATSEQSRAHIESSGVGFYAARPSWHVIPPPIPMNLGQEIAPLLRRGPFYNLRSSCDDLMVAVQGADLLVTLNLVYAGPLVAEKTGIPWVSVVLEPSTLHTAYEPLVTAPIFSMPRCLRTTFLGTGCSLGPMADSVVLRFGTPVIRYWVESVQQVRAELGLPPGKDPFFGDYHSPDLVLALFSPMLGLPQPDWPPQTRVTGFVYYDRLGAGSGLPRYLAQFMDTGPPPVVFTLSSDAVIYPSKFSAESFYTESLNAARLLGCRAVLLGMSLLDSAPYSLEWSPFAAANVVTASYAPFSELFPRAAAIVHHGGIGTTALALQAGRPMLVVPDSYAQPDTAARVTRLGVARTIPRQAYTGAAAAVELLRLLNDPGYAMRAAMAGHQVRAEDGVGAACNAIEERLARR
ncbi:MAG TPA: nucleotide disphospho-sugar-binding domain-containing protein [Candidatus Tectomicrobia bacterium]|nr:nucleotide disphospho-sugar-binding domain-containing protein [Candidatus Tectomicrobia bacterium]